MTKMPRNLTAIQSVKEYSCNKKAIYGTSRKLRTVSFEDQDPRVWFISKDNPSVTTADSGAFDAARVAGRPGHSLASPRRTNETIWSLRGFPLAGASPLDARDKAAFPQLNRECGVSS